MCLFSQIFVGETAAGSQHFKAAQQPHPLPSGKLALACRTHVLPVKVALKHWIQA